jgi:hypothetical protein
MSGNAVKNYSKRRYLDINGDEVKTDVMDDLDDECKDNQLMEYHMEDADGNKIESSYVEVQEQVSDLRDEDIIEQVQSDGQQHHYQSQPLGLSHENGTLQIILTNNGGGIPSTLADMVSRMNHPGGQTILLQSQDNSDDKDDLLDDTGHVVVTTSSDLANGNETIVIRNLEEHSPEMQKEILNALLQHHAEQQHLNDGITTRTMRYVIDNRREDDVDNMCNDNVKVEAEPTVACDGEMSPESLTAISGHHQHSDKHDESLDMSRINVNEFMRK